MKGFILIYTIVIILAVAVVSFAAMQLMSDKIKSFHLRNRQILAWIETKKNLTSIQNSLKHKSFRCLIPPQSAAEIRNQPLSFWQKMACRGKGQWGSYYFVLEFLGHQPCGKIVNQLGVDFIRISILVILKLKSSSFLLQRTIAIHSKKTSICKEKIIILNPGIQSQRELFWTG